MIDLVKPDAMGDDSKVEHYVAMSRARALLSVVWFDKKHIKSL